MNKIKMYIKEKSKRNLILYAILVIAIIIFIWMSPILIYGEWLFWDSIRSDFMRGVITPIVTATIAVYGISYSLKKTFKHNLDLQLTQFQIENKLKMIELNNKILLDSLFVLNEIIIEIDEVLFNIESELIHINSTFNGKYQNEYLQLEKDSKIIILLDKMIILNKRMFTCISGTQTIILNTDFLNLRLEIGKYVKNTHKLLIEYKKVYQVTKMISEMLDSNLKENANLSEALNTEFSSLKIDIQTDLNN